MHLTTRAKDIHLEDVSGNLKIDNSNGTVEYRAGKDLGDVEINNQRGTVQVMLPNNAAFQVDARADRGEIESDFPSIQVKSEHNSQSASGTVGSGGPQVRLTNDRGDVHIRQSSAGAPPRPFHHSHPRRRPHRACSAARCSTTNGNVVVHRARPVVQAKCKSTTRTGTM